MAGGLGACLIRRDSVLGLRLWAAARMVEVAYKRFVQQLSGTWAMNAYLRALGAKIGDWSNVRLGLCLPLLPDNLAIGAGCATATPVLFLALHPEPLLNGGSWLCTRKPCRMTSARPQQRVVKRTSKVQCGGYPGGPHEEQLHGDAAAWRSCMAISAGG
jgi:hypothetical protein